MRNAIIFLLFVFFILFVIVYQVINFWWLVGIICAIFLGVIIGMICSEEFRENVGWFMWEIGGNNNLRWYILCGITVIFLLLGIKYGAGEPLFLSTLKWTKETAAPHYTPERQESVNQFAYGLAKDDKQIKREYAYLHLENNYKAILKQEGNLRPRPKGAETDDEYNQMIRNWSVYKVFLNDAKLKGWLTNLKDWQPPEATQEEESERTWFFWKAFFAFLLITLFTAPFAFRDEVADWLEGAYEGFKMKRDEIKSALAMPAPAAVPAAGAGAAPAIATTAAPDAAAALGKFGWLYTSDMAAEFTMKLLQTIIKALR